MIKAVEKNIEKQDKPKKISGKDTLPPKVPEFGQHRITEIPLVARKTIFKKA